MGNTLIFVDLNDTKFDYKIRNIRLVKYTHSPSDLK